MKTKFAILGSLAVVSAGIWYLFFKKDSRNDESYNPVGPIHPGNSQNHIRKVIHTAKAKAIAPVVESPSDS